MHVVATYHKAYRYSVPMRSMLLSDTAKLNLHGVWTHATNLVRAHLILASDLQSRTK